MYSIKDRKWTGTTRNEQYLRIKDKEERIINIFAHRKGEQKFLHTRAGHALSVWGAGGEDDVYGEEEADVSEANILAIKEEFLRRS